MNLQFSQKNTSSDVDIINLRIVPHLAFAFTYLCQEYNNLMKDETPATRRNF